MDSWSVCNLAYEYIFVECFMLKYSVSAYFVGKLLANVPSKFSHFYTHFGEIDQTIYWHSL